MSRTLKLVLLVALAWMTAVALGVGAWRWNEIGDHLAALTPQQRGRWWTGTLMMGFFPAWVGMGAFLWSRHKRSGLKMAPDTKRHHEITWLAAIALAVGVQAWVAGTMLGLIPKQAIGVRVVEALAGIFITVASNFAAKTSPPTGENAPDPAAWTRAMLRVGWSGVIAGLVIVIASITVAIDRMVWIIFAATLSNVAFALWQRRTMLRRPA